MADAPSSPSAPAPLAQGRPAAGRLRYLALAVPLVVILAVIVLVYRNYATQRERYFTDHYLRSLAILAGQIEGAVDGLESSVDGALLAWDRRAKTLRKTCASGLQTRFKGPRPDCTRQAVCKDLDSAIAGQLGLVPIKLSKTVPPEVSKLDAAPSVLAGGGAKRLEQTRDNASRAASDTDEPPLETANATLYFCRKTPPAVRRAARELGCGGLVAAPRICAEKDLGDLVRPLLQAGTFEALDVFVLDDAGTARFERGKSGVRLAALRPSTAGKRSDEAAPEPSGELPGLEHVMAKTVVREFKVDGATFKLFSQPLRIDAGAKGEVVTWAVGVLAPLAAAHGDERRIPLLVLGGIPALVLLAALLLPFLHIVTIGSREALTGATVFGVAVALLSGSAVATIGALDWLALLQTRERLDRELKHFAGALEEAFSAELDLALTALAEFRQARGALRLQNDGLRGGYVTCDHVLDAQFSCRCDDLDDCPDVELPRTGRTAPWVDTYPSFDLLVLSDASGQQLEKWTTADLATPVADTATYSSHKDPMNGRLLQRPGPGDRRYALNVMTSPNTGRVLNVLSMPIPHADGRPLGVALMVGHFLSLHDPVVAPDIAFAVIDRSGRVVFHSHERRRLYENFFAESSGDLRMRSALFARQAGFFEMEYRGQPQRAYVRPLRDTAWSLVVLRDRDPLRTLGVEVGALSLVAFLWLGALYAAWALLGRWLLGPALSAALWPDPRAAARYRLLLAPLVMLPVWMVAALAHGDRAAQLGVIVVGPLIALSIVLLTIGLGHATTRRWLVGAGALLGLMVVAGWISLRLFGIVGALLWLAVTALIALMVASWEPSWIPASCPSGSRCARRYAALALLLLINLGVLPAAAVFRDAFAAGAEGMIRARQIKLSERIEQSRLELDRQVKGFKGGDGLKRFWQEHRDWIETGLRAFRAAAGAGAPPADARPVTRDVAAVLRRLDAELCGTPAGHNAGDAPGPCGAPADGAQSWCAALGEHFTTPLVHSLPVYTRESLEHRHMMFRAAADGSWAVPNGDGEFCAQARFASGAPPLGGSPEPLVRLPGWNLALARPGWPLPIVPVALMAVLVGYGLWRLLGWVFARVFCLDVWDVVELDATVASATGGYYLRPSPATLDALRRRPATTVIDLRTVARADDLLGSIGAAATGRVLLLHLEYEIDDVAWNRRKLELLEELLIRRGVAVDLVSEVDVLGYFSRRIHSAWDRADDSYVSPREMERWAQVLARLDKQRADLPPPPLPPRPGNTALLYDECRWTTRLRGIRAAIAADPRWTALSPESLLQHIGDLADAHYRTVWYLLTDEERLVLYHLAVTGFVNPKNHDLARRLMRRGLIHRAPALRVMNESFRRFVQYVEDRATIRAWERAAGASSWTWVRNGALALVVIVAVLLFITRPATYTRWVALLTAVTTLGGGMTQLLGLFQTQRRQGTS